MQDTDFNKNCNNVLDCLYVGNRKAPDIPDYKFSLIVNCTKDLKFSKNCDNNIRLPINDNPDECKRLYYYILETKILEKIHEYINKKEPVLIHCQGGIQRSCAVTACYLIKYNNMNPVEAIQYIKICRPIAFFGQVNFIETIQLFYDYINKNDKQQQIV